MNFSVLRLTHPSFAFLSQLAEVVGKHTIQSLLSMSVQVSINGQLDPRFNVIIVTVFSVLICEAGSSYDVYDRCFRQANLVCVAPRVHIYNLSACSTHPSVSVFCALFFLNVCACFLNHIIFTFPTA